MADTISAEFCFLLSCRARPVINSVSFGRLRNIRGLLHTGTVNCSPSLTQKALRVSYKACFSISAQYRNLPFHCYTSFCLTQHTPKFYIRVKKTRTTEFTLRELRRQIQHLAKLAFFSLARGQMSSEEKKKSV